MLKLKYVKLIQICCISVHLNELSEREIKEIIPLTKLRRKKCLGINLPKASLIAQLVKNKTNLLAMQETPVQFLGWDDLLEKG